jgi:predicted XRE-type DNA-binding protein
MRYHQSVFVHHDGEHSVIMGCRQPGVVPFEGGRTAQEFLGLSSEETAYIELKLKLGEGLRERRTRRKLSQVELATLVRSSQSRVAKMEAGDPSVSIDVLVKTLLALGVSRKELAEVIQSPEPPPA